MPALLHGVVRDGGDRRAAARSASRYRNAPCSTTCRCSSTWPTTGWWRSPGPATGRRGGPSHDRAAVLRPLARRGDGHRGARPRPGHPRDLAALAAATPPPARRRPPIAIGPPRARPCSTCCSPSEGRGQTICLSRRAGRGAARGPSRRSPRPHPDRGVHLIWLGEDPTQVPATTGVLIDLAAAIVADRDRGGTAGSPPPTASTSRPRGAPPARGRTSTRRRCCRRHRAPGDGPAARGGRDLRGPR